MKKLIKKFIPVFVLFALFTSSSFIAPSISYALPSSQPCSFDSNNINCYSLDVVFLIDQSGSMKGNDPSGLRKSAVDWVVDWLGDNVLSYCPAAIHRIAVVSWGDNTEI